MISSLQSPSTKWTIAVLAILTCASAVARGDVAPSLPPATTQPSDSRLAAYKVQPKLETAIKRFETTATTQPAKTGGTVFIGSSSFTKWKTLEKDMAQFDAVNRGFGGSHTDDLLYYARRILQPLQPARIVCYCGGNDVDQGRPAETIAANIQAFMKVVRQDFPGVKVYYFATNYTPKRAKRAGVIRDVNQAVQRWAQTTSDVIYVDAMTGLLDAEGNPMATLFLKDGIHLNADGYRIWQANITKALSTPAPQLQAAK